MTISFKKLITGILLLAVCGFCIYAQDNGGKKEEDVPFSSPPHLLGEQSIGFSLGLFLPLFYYKLDPGVIEGTNLSIGARGAITYNAYLSNSFTLGIEFCGAFAFSPNYNAYWSLPITLKASYIIYLGETEMPLSLGAGLDFASFLGYSRMDFILKPEFAMYWKIDPKISLGFSISYWFIPALASAEQEAHSPGQSRLVNLIDLSISLKTFF